MVEEVIKFLCGHLVLMNINVAIYYVHKMLYSMDVSCGDGLCNLNYPLYLGEPYFIRSQIIDGWHLIV